MWIGRQIDRHTERNRAREKRRARDSEREIDIQNAWVVFVGPCGREREGEGDRGIEREKDRDSDSDRERDRVRKRDLDGSPRLLLWHRLRAQNPLQLHLSFSLCPPLSMSLSLSLTLSLCHVQAPFGLNNAGERDGVSKEDLNDRPRLFGVCSP